MFNIEGKKEACAQAERIVHSISQAICQTEEMAMRLSQNKDSDKPVESVVFMPVHPRILSDHMETLLSMRIETLTLWQRIAMMTEIKPEKGATP